MSLLMRLFILLALLIILFLGSLLWGSAIIPFEDVLRILTGQGGSSETWEAILFQYRLPKSLTAVVAGMSLSVAGLQMQTFFRNPLADPFVLGISSGGSLGVALLLMGGGLLGFSTVAFSVHWGLAGIALFSIMGSLVMLFIILIVSRFLAGPSSLLMVGLMSGYISSSFVTALLFYSDAERMRSYMLWTMGSFSSVSYSALQIMTLPILIALFLSYTQAKPLNAYLLGEEYASSLGVNVKRLRIMILLSCALLTGSVTAFCGPIGFMGIAVPHISRSLFPVSNHHIQIPATALCGAILALVAETLSQFPGSAQALPLNSIMALLGAPVVLTLILKNRASLHGSHP